MFHLGEGKTVENRDRIGLNRGLHLMSCHTMRSGYFRNRSLLLQYFLVQRMCPEHSFVNQYPCHKRNAISDSIRVPRQRVESQQDSKLHYPPWCYNSVIPVQDIVSPMKGSGC